LTCCVRCSIWCTILDSLTGKRLKFWVLVLFKVFFCCHLLSLPAGIERKEISRIDTIQYVMLGVPSRMFWRASLFACKMY